MLKIKEINGYRFFNQFRWDEQKCKPFVENNLIYGWNGSGKTTLCDFFKEIESGTITDPNVSFNLMFSNSADQSHPTIQRNQLGTIPYRFRVFYQNYGRENVTEIDRVRHIFAVGKKQKEKVDELRTLKEQERSQIALVKTRKAELDTLKQSFEQQKTAKAKVIKNAANYSNAYNKNVFYSAYSHLKKPNLLTNEDYQKAISAIHAEKRNTIPFPSFSFIQPTVKDYIYKILVETPVNATIASLKDDAPVSTWVEQGLRLHDDRKTNTCFFCGGTVTEERINRLKDHFNQSYIRLSNQIDSAVKLLNDRIQQFRDAKTNLPSAQLLYPELRDEYESSCSNALSICDLYIQALEQVAKIVTAKKSNMIDVQCAEDFLTIMSTLSFDFSVFSRLQDIINQHNEITADFQRSIQAAQKKVEQHHLSEFYSEIAKFEEDIKKKGEEFTAEDNGLKILQSTIRDLEVQVKNSQIPADAINREIAFIMGRSELVFSNSDLGYTITRNGKTAKNLSKGEENAVALIYFFNTLLDVDENIESTIVILDDPISSFDSNFYYNAISYIREKTSNVGQTFIFTHKFSLFKDYSLMYRDKTNRYLIKRLGNKPCLVDEEKTLSQFHDEYTFLFKKIYDFVKAPPADTSEYLQYPNIARRLLEGYLSFKLPKPESEPMLNKVLQLEDGHNTAAGRAVLRLLNNHSHFRIIPNGESSDEIDSITALPTVLGQLLEFMRDHDRLHYDTLAKYCDETYTGEGAAVEIETPFQKIVKLYAMPSSAGTGNSLDSEVPFDEITVTKPECSFAIKISGNSMEPEYPDGCIVLVKQSEVIPVGHIGIVWYDGQSYCKKVIRRNSQVELRSINTAYSPIVVTSTDYRVFGEVIGIVDPGITHNTLCREDS